jgi:acyl-CoA dehydrogenase
MSDARSLITESINRIFADAVDRSLLERFEKGEWPAELWKLVEESGFHRVLSEDAAMPAWTDAEPVLRAIGYYRAPLPLAETLVGNWLLALAGLPVEDGPLALAQCDDALKLEQVGNEVVLAGEAKRVAWASRARRLVVAGTLERQTVIGVLRLEDAKPRALRGANLALEPRDTLSFERMPLAASASLKGLDATPVLTYGALARAAMLAGAVESVLEQALQYANDRVQFGRPIGKFQVIQHALAEIGSESAAAGAAVSAACESAGTRRARLDIAAAKVRAGAAALIAARVVHQVHGAIGFTYEHTLQYATRRLWSWRNEFGNDAYWARELGVAAIKRGAERFWADITA